MAALLATCKQSGYTVTKAVLVAGSQIDPDFIANQHIRAHAFEGRLFRSALTEALHHHRIETDVLIERDAYARAPVKLNKSRAELRDAIQNFGRSTVRSWRAEQKLAALAAWLALY